MLRTITYIVLVLTGEVVLGVLAWTGYSYVRFLASNEEPLEVVPDLPSLDQFSLLQVLTAGILLFDGPAWKHRSVRKIHFKSPDVVHEQISIDVTIPRFGATPATGTSPYLRSILFVPLVLVSKRKLVNVDLFDGTGTSLPILNKEHEQPLTLTLLNALWDSYFPAEQLPDIARKHLYGILTCRRPYAERHYYAFLAFAPRVQDTALLKAFLATLLPFINRSPLYAVHEGEDRGSRVILKVGFDDLSPWTRPSLPRIAADGARGLLRKYCVRPLPVRRYLSGQVEGVDASFRAWFDAQVLGRQRSVELHRRPPLPRYPTRLWRNVRGWLRGPLSRIGIVSRPYEGAFSPLMAASEHLEVEAPPRTFFARGTLSTPAPKGRRKAVDSIRRGAVHAHLHVSGAAPIDLAYEVRLRAGRRGWLLAATVSSGVLAALLTLLWFHGARLTGGAAAAIVAIVIGIATVTTVYLVRPQEHLMTTRLLEGPRLALFISSVAGLAAMVLLAFDRRFSQSDGAVVTYSLFDDWIVVPSLSALLALLVLLANYVGGAIGRLSHRWELLRRSPLGPRQQY